MDQQLTEYDRGFIEGGCLKRYTLPEYLSDRLQSVEENCSREHGRAERYRRMSIWLMVLVALLVQPYLWAGVRWVWRLVER